MHETVVAFAEREADLAKMSIVRREDGTLAARRRAPDDSIEPTHQIGQYNDIWMHVRSGGRYVRHDEVLDIETGRMCYDYSSYADGRLWLRPVQEWHEVVNGRPRFERLG